MRLKSNATASVVIPSYNSTHTIETSLKFLLRQTIIDQINEIIIVDSSDDGVTKGILNKFENEKIVTLNSGTKIIPAIQRNFGAKRATGDVLLFIDSDAYPALDWAEKILEAYKSGHSAGGGSYRIPEFQSKNNLAKAQYYLEFNEFIDRGRKRFKKIIPSCNFFCNRKLFLELGGFPEIRASEDSLLSLKINKSEKMIFLPNATVYHIFREQEDHFLNNQKLLGSYIYIYRNLYYRSFYLNRMLVTFLLPAFFLVKIIRINYRIILSGWSHLINYISSLPLFLKGLICWTQGFLLASKDKNNNPPFQMKLDLEK
jgi:glycosyltransferase involved in cell wall biosynthesis